jgi:hypothetical protein
VATYHLLPKFYSKHFQAVYPAEHSKWIARGSYTLKPSVQVVEVTDGYGNLCQRLIAPPGEFSIRTSADVMTADTIDVAPGAPRDEIQNLPDAVLNIFCQVAIANLSSSLTWSATS